MLKLLKIEAIKLLNYTSFKVLLGLHLALFTLVVFVSSRINLTVPGFDTANLFRFPHVWSYFTWIASWFNLLLAITIIMVTGNEFSYRTFRQHVIDGLERLQLLKGKLMVILAIALYGVVLVFLTGLIYGIIYSSGSNSGPVFGNAGILVVYFLQTLAWMVVGLMTVMILKSTALSIILFILLRFPVEPIIRSFFDPAIRPFFPMKAISGLTPMPEFLSIASENSFETMDGGNALSLSEIGLLAPGLPPFLQILITAGYIALFLGVISFILIKRDL
jgi:ABC-2 type transport system permease protein